MAERITADAYSYPWASCRKRTPQIMSKMVVGMKSRPAITPHRMDCGFLKTVTMARAAPFIQSSPSAGFSCLGRRTKSTAPTARPATPMTIQNRLQGTPADIAGPTRNCPADPPAIPNICVAPIRVAAREAGKLVVAM